MILIGLLTGFNEPIDTSPILFKKVRLQGSGVGPVQMAEAMAETIAALRLKPVIAEVFEFDRARDALARLQETENFGKVVIRIE